MARIIPHRLSLHLQGIGIPGCVSRLYRRLHRLPARGDAAPVTLRYNSPSNLPFQQFCLPILEAQHHIHQDRYIDTSSFTLKGPTIALGARCSKIVVGVPLMVCSFDFLCCFPSELSWKSCQVYEIGLEITLKMVVPGTALYRKFLFLVRSLSRKPPSCGVGKAVSS